MMTAIFPPHANQLISVAFSIISGENKKRPMCSLPSPPPLQIQGSSLKVNLTAS